jgi:hypothetical protein
VSHDLESIEPLTPPGPIDTMARDGDAENQINVNQQTPLLDNNQSGQQPDQNDHEHKGAWWYVSRIFWAIVIALVLGVFIKGWIDAGGDTDVSATT